MPPGVGDSTVFSSASRRGRPSARRQPRRCLPASRLEPGRRHAPDPAAGAGPARRLHRPLGLRRRCPSADRGAVRRDRRCRRRRHASPRPRRRRVPRRRRAAAAHRRQRRRRLRQHRRPRLRLSRRPRHQHAGGVDRRDRRHRFRPDPDDHAAARRGRATRPGGPCSSWSMFFHLGAGIQGKHLGIVGLGQIGRATARRGRAFGMEIVYSGRAGPTRRRRMRSRPSSCRSTSCSRRPMSSRFIARSTPTRVT